MRYIDDRKGQFLRDEDGSFHLILEGRRIPLRYHRENLKLAKLLLDSIGISILSSGVQAAIQRLEVEASNCAGDMRLKRFSALSTDLDRLYVPTADGKLLLVTAGGVDAFPNGENRDRFWVEHPYNDPLQYSTADSAAGLATFERLLVETQACAVPAMRWLIGINAGFFPFVRDSCPARFLLELLGGTQQGKTSGAQRFTQLHGLGLVKGDFTVAALAALGDIGLLVLDNKEQANFTQELSDFCLYLATGAERGRAHVDGRLRTGDAGRPVGIITTIEGVVKAELRARCVEVHYSVSGAKTPRAPIEHEISERRQEIGSAMMQVLARYFHIQNEHRPTPNPIPDFEEHFTALCDLLRAFGEVAGKPVTWSEDLIASWNTVLSGAEEDDDELEQPILRVLDTRVTPWPGPLTEEQFTHEGVPGRLYLTIAQDFLTSLQELKLFSLTLPRTANGLTRRLKSCKFQALTFLPTDAPGVPALKRTPRKRPIGFFRPD